MSDEAKLNPEVKAKWLEALRSGDYEQTRSYLHAEMDGKHTYCCLGVLCDLHDPNEWKKNENATYAYGYGTAGKTGYPPVSVCTWSGLSFNSTFFGSEIRAVLPEDVSELRWMDDDVKYSLVSLNDQGLSFKQIAKVIEAYL